MTRSLPTVGLLATIAFLSTSTAFAQSGSPPTVAPASLNWMAPSEPNIVYGNAHLGAGWPGTNFALVPAGDGSYKFFLAEPTGTILVYRGVLKLGGAKLEVPNIGAYSLAQASSEEERRIGFKFKAEGRTGLNLEVSYGKAR